VTPPKNAVILTHGDVDGVCAAAIAKTSYPKAEVEFTTPSDFISKLDSLSKHDCVIILDLGIATTKEAEARAAFQKLSKTSGIIYIDHHIRPPGLTKRSLACNRIVHKTDASTSELALEFFKPAVSYNFIAVLGAVGDYAEKTPQMQGLIEKYGERRVYPEALFLEWALMVAEDSFKLGVVEELVQGKWPYQMSIMGEEADYIIRRQRTLQKYVKEKAEKICEHVMLIRDPPFKATGSAAAILTDFDNVDVGLASRREGNSVYLSLRRHKESDVNLASLIEESALNFGGVGGGHKEAAGGKIPVNMFDEFLLEIRRRLPKEQLKRTRELDVESIDTKMIKRKLFKEIIEREQAEEELRESEKRYHTLFENASDAVFIVDTETGKIVYTNKKAEKLTGRNRDELIGMHYSELHPPEEAERHKRGFIDDVIHGGTVDKAALVVRKDGTKIPVLISANTFELGRKKVVQGIFHDITERKRAEEALQEAENRYRTLFEQSPSGILLIDPKTAGIIEFNDIAHRQLGYSRDEFAKLQISDFDALETPQETKARITKILREGKNVFETKHRTKDGKLRDILVTVQKVRISGKDIFHCIFHNITERKLAEDELKESREKYKELVDSITDPFFAMDKDLKCTYWNKASEKLIEISEKDVVGKHIKDIFPDSEETRGAINIYQDVLKKQRSKVFVSGYHLKDREYFLEISAYPTKDGLSVFVKDITKLTRVEEKRIRAEIEADAARERAAIIDAMGDGLVLVGMDGKITSINPAYEKMMGYKKNEIVGENAADLTKKNVKPEDLKTAMKSLEVNMKGKVPSPVTITLFTKDGREVPVIVTSSVMKDSEGKPSSLIIVFKDITEHKKAEDAVFKEP
jgi:PAS domain S-box-containing protein